MEALIRLSKNFLALRPKKILVKTMSENPILEKLAIQLVQKRQLEFGTTGNANFLGNYSAASVVHYGKDEGPIQLYDEGDFYESFEIVFVDNGFFINADGQKEDTNLFTEFGLDITKLNEANLTIFIERLIPVLINTIIKMMFRGV
jgi:hypothetical protein